MKNNKGASHVSFAISFVLFVGFLIFLFAMLQPALKIEQNKSAIVDQIKDKIIENVSEEITIISILPDPNADCVNISSLYITNNLSVKDVNGNHLYSNKTTSQVTGNLLKIYSSNDINSDINPFDCDEISEIIKTGLIKKEKFVSEKKILDLNKTYEIKYDELRNNFGIIEQNNFAFSFIYSNGSEIKTKIPEIKTTIYAEQIPIKYIDQNADIQIGYLKIITW